MGESLTEQCLVEVEAPRVVNFFSQRKSLTKYDQRISVVFRKQVKQAREPRNEMNTASICEHI
ncbi:unnamed protein product [Spirodela intermedia]|uniref:Uncharacterized protein n=1 Tax=Spirodela intermedia TaxID=51605 RepID=A0A7I8LIG5_SPIIN|nr:unnamed protein product [Spirodela intermedia]